MWKTLNLELFKPWFIFSFKWSEHLVIKDYQTEVLVINLEWDDCNDINNFVDNWDKDWYDLIESANNISDSLYKIYYVDILEDIMYSDTLRWEEIDTTLLIEDEYDNTDIYYN